MAGILTHTIVKALIAFKVYQLTVCKAPIAFTRTSRFDFIIELQLS